MANKIRVEYPLGLATILLLSGCVTTNAFSYALPGAVQANANPDQTNTGEYPSPPTQNGGNGSYPGSSNGGSGTYPNGPTLSITPNAVCGPSVSPASQATIKNTSSLVAVLYKNSQSMGNRAGGTVTVVQAWTDPATAANLYTQVAALQTFTLPLNQTLSPGMYGVVLYDASRAKSPYTYNWTNSTDAVAPIEDSVASFLDMNSTFTVDSSGNVTKPSSFNVLVGYQGDAVCQGAGTIDPLAINLGSGSISLSSQSQGVSMDLDGSGTMDLISWPNQPAKVAFLVNMSNGLPASGAIGPQQIFGNFTVGPDGKVAANGYDALRKYDDNGDGVIDSKDSIWANLRVWQDLNRNGVADSGELLTLAQAGIFSIELPVVAAGHITKENCRSDQYGNQICQGHNAYVNLISNGQTVRKQLTDIGFKPSN